MHNDGRNGIVVLQESTERWDMAGLLEQLGFMEFNSLIPFLWPVPGVSEKFGLFYNW